MNKDEIDGYRLKRRFLYLLIELEIITDDEYWDESLNDWRNKRE